MFNEFDSIADRATRPEHTRPGGGSRLDFVGPPGGLSPDDCDPDLVRGGIVLARLNDGGAVILPAGVRRLTSDQQEVASLVQESAIAVFEAQAKLEERVELARESGISWNVIGFCVGTTGDAARKRWGVE